MDLPRMGDVAASRTTLSPALQPIYDAVQFVRIAAQAGGWSPERVVREALETAALYAAQAAVPPDEENAFFLFDGILAVLLLLFPQRAEGELLVTMAREISGLRIPPAAVPPGDG